MMNESERKYASIVINYLFAEKLPPLTTPEAVTERAVIIAFEALERANACSRTMDLVPRPYIGPMNNLSYPLKEIVKIGMRIESGDERIYLLCRRILSISHYRVDIIGALSGDY